MTLSGSDFLDLDESLYCQFGEKQSAAKFHSNSSVTCEVPPGVGSVTVRYSQNVQQFVRVGSFTYETPHEPETVDLTFAEAGLIAGSVLCLVIVLVVTAAYVGYGRISKRQYTVLKSVGVDGEVCLRVFSSFTIPTYNFDS